MGEPRWFALRYGTISKHLVKLLASGPDRSGIVVNDADMGIAMGRSFNGRAPRGTVRPRERSAGRYSVAVSTAGAGTGS